MPIFHTRLSYSTHADDPRDAARMLFVAAQQPGSMVAEVFGDDCESDLAVEEFDGDVLHEIAEEARITPHIRCPETGDTYTVAQWKLAAIRARLNGITDHPAVRYYGDMTTNTNADLMVIVNS